MQKKMKRSLRKTAKKAFVLVSILTVFKLFYSYVLYPENQKLFIFIGIISIPFLLPIAWFLFKLVVMQKARELARWEMRIRNKAHREWIEKNYEKECEALALEVKSVFNLLMKTAQMSREQILEFSELIVEELGIYAKAYRHRHFKNDAHKIYVMLKDHNLDKSSLNALYKYLDDCLENSKIIPLPHKETVQPGLELKAN